MRTTTALALLAAAGVSHAAVEVTKTESVDLDAGTGELGWGALGLPFGYQAGCGLNFTADSIGGGFNAGIPNEGEGSFGGGYTLNDTALTLGLGGFLNGKGFDVAIVQDLTTGEVKLTVNGVETTM